MRNLFAREASNDRPNRAGGVSRRWRRFVAAAAVPALVLTFAAPLSAYPRPGRTEWASAGSGGVDGNDASHSPDISGDRYVAFQSRASNLVPGDTNGRRDVFVYDRVSGNTDRVSVASDGSQGNEHSEQPSISADGRYVAFYSLAPNLAPGDTGALDWDVFVHDRETATTSRLSVGIEGAEGNGDSYSASVSADGRYVAFASLASNLVLADSNAHMDIFVHDRETGATARVSMGADGVQANGQSATPDVSEDGRRVAFWSEASNLVPGDFNGTSDVFLHDMDTQVISRVSVGADGAEANGRSDTLSISGGGRYVAFQSRASNLVAGDTNGTSDVFVRDMETETTERVSVNAKGEQANGASYWPSLSIDGRYVALYSYASNLVPGDSNAAADVFVRDRATGATERASVGGDGSQANGHSFWPSVSADGRFVALQSLASNLAPGEGTWDVWDVFVRDRGRPLGVGDLSAVAEGERLSVSGRATFSGEVVVSAADPADDAGPGSRVAGADLRGASVTVRPENEDLLVRLHLESLPLSSPRICHGGTCIDANISGGAPAILYGLRFRLGEAQYEIRASRAAVSASYPTASHFALYRCDPGCTEVAPLSGGIGTTGPEVVVSVPSSVLGFEDEVTLTGLRAFTAVGEATRSLVALDEVDLPDATIPVARVSLGISPFGTPEAAVTFETETTLTEGAFTGIVDVSSFSEGVYEVWSRACLGKACGTVSRSFALE